MAPRHPNDGKQLNFCIRYNLDKKKKKNEVMAQGLLSYNNNSNS